MLKHILKRKINRDFDAREFLENLGLYVVRVQDEVHARRGRVAMFWSLASLLYAFGLMQVKDDLQFSAVGISFPGLNILVVLFVITTCYAVRFGHSAIKIIAFVNPWTLWRDLWIYTELKKSDFDFESFEWNVDYYEQIAEFDKLYFWETGKSALMEKYEPREVVEMRRKNEEEMRKMRERMRQPGGEMLRALEESRRQRNILISDAWERARHATLANLHQLRGAAPATVSGNISEQKVTPDDLRKKGLAPSPSISSDLKKGREPKGLLLEPSPPREPARFSPADQPRVDKEDDVRQHNLRYPILGYWENFFFLMYFPMGVCIFALSALVGGLASYYIIAPLFS